MKKLSLLFAILLISANAQAASSASATLSNFQINVISGDDLVPYLDTLSVGINTNVSDQFLTNVHDFTYTIGLPFSLSLTTVDGLSSGTGNATGTNQIQSLSATAFTSGGIASADVSGSMQFEYKAFTLFSFTADATVFGSADIGNGINGANSRSEISLSKSSFNDAITNFSLYSNLISGSGLFESGTYSSSHQVKFFFYDDEDSYIHLSAGVYTTAIAVPTMTPVPEPETYGMMLAGLGLIGFAARKRNS